METTKKYFVNDDEVSEEIFDSIFENEISIYCENNYDDMLDECYEPFKIGYLNYSPSDVLKRVDEVAYRCGLSDFESYTLDDYKDELYRYNEYTLNSVEFKIVEEDEEETESETE